MRSLAYVLGSLLLAASWAAPSQAKSVALSAWDSGQRLPIVGTQYSIGVPVYFRASYGELGSLLDLDHGAKISAVPIGAYERQFVDMAKSGPGGSFSLSLTNFLGKPVRAVWAGDLEYLVLTRDSVEDDGSADRKWTVIPLQTPDLAIVIVQRKAEGAVFDDDTVTAVIKTLLVTKPYSTEKGVYIFGLFIPTIPPFTWSAILASGEGAELSALVPGTDGYTISIRRPRVLNVDFPGPIDRDRLLNESMTLSISELSGAVLVGTEEASLGGLAALRARARKPDVFAPTGYVEYIAWTIGYEFSFLGTGLEKDLNDDVIRIMDRIAHAVRPQTSSELMGD